MQELRGTGSLQHFSFLFTLEKVALDHYISPHKSVNCYLHKHQVCKYRHWPISFYFKLKATCSNLVRVEHIRVSLIWERIPPLFDWKASRTEGQDPAPIWDHIISMEACNKILPCGWPQNTSKVPIGELSQTLLPTDSPFQDHNSL